MNDAQQIVQALLENDNFDPKAEIEAMGAFVHPKIKTTFSKVRFHDDGSGDYDEEHGFEDEEGHEVEVDEFDREEGMDVAEAAARWLRDKGYLEPSSSHFHPGTWYSATQEDYDREGWSTTRSFHLEGFTPEEEQKIFNLLMARKRGAW
jgi:hypothetical protein